MGLFDWLFGKKETSVVPVASRPAQQPASAGPALAPPPAPSRPAVPVLPAEEDNLRRWRESGEARAWVESRRGQWNHQDWLALLESLRRSRYWPMRPEAVGLVLEEIKREWSNGRR